MIYVAALGAVTFGRKDTAVFSVYVLQEKLIISLTLNLS